MQNAKNDTELGFETRVSSDILHSIYKQALATQIKLWS